MMRRSRHNGHDQYKSRITYLFKSYHEDEGSSPETQAHSAKYLAVLVSGYLEQAIKEILLDYSTSGSRAQISRYIAETWPSSQNMSTKNIKTLLKKFDTKWSDDFSSWLDEEANRKGDINSIISWRNSIAHGQESNTTGVTLVSVKDKFLTVQSLVVFLESGLRGVEPEVL